MAQDYKIAAFDFDGTITNRDSFIEFIRFVHGNLYLIKGLFVNSIILVAYILGLCPNWKAKQKLFSYFFKNMPVEQLNEEGEKFMNSRPDEFFKMTALNAIEQYKKDKYIIVIISASPENWILPFAKKMG